jgi:hypothetical protein
MYEQIESFNKAPPKVKKVYFPQYNLKNTEDILKERVSKWDYTGPLTSREALDAMGYAKSSTSLKTLHDMAKQGLIKRAGQKKVGCNTAYLWQKIVHKKD